VKLARWFAPTNFFYAIALFNASELPLLSFRRPPPWSDLGRDYGIRGMPEARPIDIIWQQ
jgi:hypothetical protein